METANLSILNRALGERCCAEDLRDVLPAADVDALTSELETLAHPIRLRLLSLIAGSAVPICVCDLEAAVPVKQPTVSHHLKLLRVAGLVESEKRGLWAYYSIRREALERLRVNIVAGLDRLVGGGNA